MIEVTAKPRALKALHWDNMTGIFVSDADHPDFAKGQDLRDRMHAFVTGFSYGVDPLHKILHIDGPLGRVVAHPTRDVPEHMLGEQVIPAGVMTGQWVTRDENDQFHVWTDEAFHAAFDR